jgi:hypothetical protein
LAYTWARATHSPTASSWTSSGGTTTYSFIGRPGIGSKIYAP